MTDTTDAAISIRPHDRPLAVACMRKAVAALPAERDYGVIVVWDHRRGHYMLRIVPKANAG